MSASRRAGALRAAAVLAAGSLVAAGCGLLPKQGVVAHPLSVLPVPAQQQVATVTVQTGTVVASQQVAGTVAPLQTALLYFTVGGKVATLNMRNNQVVQKGDVLATLDSGNIAFQISQMGLTIQQDQLHINDLENSLQTSPPTSAEDAANRMVAVQQAQLQLQADQLQQQKLQLQLQQYQIVAPFSGKLTNVSVHTGDGVGQYQVLAQLQDMEGAQFIATLTPAQAQIISPGQPVALTLSSNPQAKLATTVNSVQVPTDQAAAIAQANGGLGGLTKPQVTLNLPGGYTFNPSDIGSSFNAVITVAEADNVLYLPKGVVFQFNGLDYVFLVKNGQTVERPVTVGLGGDQDIVITAGLQDGDTVLQQ